MNSRILQRDNKTIVTMLYMATVVSMRMMICYGAGRDGPGFHYDVPLF